MYNVPCNGCHLSCIGQTKKKIEIQLKGHSNYPNNREVSISSDGNRSWNSGHSFNFQNSKILFKANSTSELEFLENLAIYLNREVIDHDS